MCRPRRSSRRRFLDVSLHGSLGAVLGAGGAWLLPSTGEQPLPVVLGHRSMFEEPGVYDFPDIGVVVRSTPSGLALISTRCTHLGCRVRVVGDELRCPCHAGRFSLDGEVIAGPPPAHLPWLRGGISARGLVYCFPGQVDAARRLVSI
jgi:cytochrome b6-f complex iron-sulfur subunit